MESSWCICKKNWKKDASAPDLVTILKGEKPDAEIGYTRRFNQLEIKRIVFA